MKKRPQPKIPENFWATPEGAPLYDTLHSDVDLSEATEQEIKTEYSPLKKLGLLSDKSNPPKHNRKRGIHGTDHSD